VVLSLELSEQCRVSGSIGGVAYCCSDVDHASHAKEVAPASNLRLGGFLKRAPVCSSENATAESKKCERERERMKERKSARSQGREWRREWGGEWRREWGGE
jgi:hypothetical protein